MPGGATTDKSSMKSTRSRAFDADTFDWIRRWSMTHGIFWEHWAAGTSCQTLRDLGAVCWTMRGCCARVERVCFAPRLWYTAAATKNTTNEQSHIEDLPSRTLHRLIYSSSRIRRTFLAVLISLRILSETSHAAHCTFDSCSAPRDKHLRSLTLCTAVDTTHFSATFRNYHIHRRASARFATWSLIRAQ